ncbi:MAG: Holliday junction branch migration protein RuvA [Coriobacteriia bacterium]|nr:Holliday junction branch migration protein RuvA [Coriobacteriia bacterium]
MIAFLTGRVAHKGAGHCLLEVGGIGYRLAMSTASLSSLPALGDEVLVHTHLHVREDELSLFGFESEAEKAAFEALITVSGVGPKVALAALSALSPEEIASAVAMEDVATISSVPGIGTKTAQRIILDLKDKLGPTADSGAASGRRGAGAALAEATDALLGMGFSAAEASAALKGASSDAGAQELLRHALVRLGGGR